MTRLSVNVNKLATLRNARGKNTPNVKILAEKILSYGAHGITVHPRPDGRHIRSGDVIELQQVVSAWNSSTKGAEVEFNVEGFPADDFMHTITSLRPHQCTLVPDPPTAITSNAGWNLVQEEKKLSDVLKLLKVHGVRSSVFIDPQTFDKSQQEALARLRPDRIELYTEAYAEAFSRSDRERLLGNYRQTAEWARTLGVGVNAGHDLNQNNLAYFIEKIPWILEVSIGHALICEALEAGLEATVCAYLKILGSL